MSKGIGKICKARSLQMQKELSLLTMAHRATLLIAYKPNIRECCFINCGILYRKKTMLHKGHISSEALSRCYKEAINVRRAELHVVQRAFVELLQSCHALRAVNTGTIQKIWYHVNIVDDQFNNFREHKWI